MSQPAETSKTDTDGRSGKLGTFAGVFTPSILTILGIILFLRLGYVVGSAGLGRAIIILLVANGISVLTSISLSAIATNLRVKGGGDYYLISRTLGPEFGGSIGIVLFLAQSVSIAFYCIGFAEVVVRLVGLQAALAPQIIAAVAVGFLFIFAWLGADWATRFQYVVMGILTAALFSFFIGGLSHWDVGLLSQNWTAPEAAPPFWVIFAIFFPAVTGFTQGVSMSGDLKNPGKSLPVGTFAAVAVSIIVYFLAALMFAATLPQDILMNDYSAMKQVAAVRFLVIAGVVAATLSSAMASFLGAPRILQSLAGDRIIPILVPFAKGYGAAANPRRGVLLSAAIALATIALGNLNFIAPVVSMFFLISYGLLNYATFYEARAGSPSFRPRFRWYDYRASLAGALACMGVMLAIDLAAGIVASALLFAIYKYINKTVGPARWADSQRAYHLQQIRHHLLAAANEPDHPRNWRPQILLFSDDTIQRGQLLKFAEWVQGNSGFTTVVRVLRGQGLKVKKLLEATETQLRKEIEEIDLEAFPLVITTADVNQAIHTLVQAHGIGPLRANTFLFNWVEQQSKEATRIFELLYGRTLRTAHRMGCNLLVFNAQADEWKALLDTGEKERTIDCWWWGDATSRLMLLLAYLMTRADDWHAATIRLIGVVNGRSDEITVEGLKQILEDVRISAEPHVVEKVDADTIAATSSDASLVFLPFRLRKHHLLDPFGQQVDPLLTRIPPAVLVMAAEDIDLDAEPEDGQVGEIAAAQDALADAEHRVRETQKELEQASKAVETVKAKLKKIQSDPNLIVDETVIDDMMADVTHAEKQMTIAYRRFAKARAKAEVASKEAEEVGAKPVEPQNGENTGGS